MFLNPPVAITNFAGVPIDLSAVSGGPAGFDPIRLLCYGADDSTITVDGVLYPMISTDGVNGYLDLRDSTFKILTAVSGVTRVVVFWSDTIPESATKNP